MRHFIPDRLTNALFVAFILISPFVLFWRWVIKGEVLFWGTLLLQFWPWHHLVKLNLLNGRWPLWNPLLGNGTPLLANLQTAVFYPPNLIYLFLPVAHAMTVSIILHLLLAGLLMYLYARQLGLSAFAAAVSGLAYMFSGYLVGRTQFITMINAAAWFPLLLLLSDKLAGQRKLSHSLWLAFVLAVQLLAGHAQLWFYGLWLLGAYTVFRSWQKATRPLANLLDAGWRLALAVALALLLAAAQLLPTAEFVSQSPRNDGAERVFALTYSFWPWRLISLLAPDFFGNPAQNNYWGYSNYWEDHAYIGVLPFILALTAIWSYVKLSFWPPKQPETGAGGIKASPLSVVPFFATLIPISVVLALGWNTPVYLWIFDLVPGFRFFQGPARLMIWYTLAMAVLAGIGAEWFVMRPALRPNWRRFLAACVAITVAGLAGETVLTGRALTFLTATRTLGLLLIISVTLLLIQPEASEDAPAAERNASDTAGNRRWIIKKNLWRWAIVIFIAADLILAALPLLPATSATVFNQQIASAEFLKTQPGQYRFFTDEDFAYAATFEQYFRFQAFGPTESSYWQDYKETLAPNLGVYAGLPAVNNNDPLVVGRWQQLVNQLENAGEATQARLLSLMNAGYLIDAPDVHRWPAVYTYEQFAIQQLPEPLPRAYFVSGAVYLKDEAAALARLIAPDFDPRRELVIINNGQQNVPAGNPPAASITETVVDVRDLNDTHIRLQVDAPGAGFVVLTDTYYPGWQVTVDGRPGQILPANLAFRAVAVEPGQHEIEFKYSPRTFTFGLWTSMISCLIMIMVSVRLASKPKRPG